MIVAFHWLIVVCYIVLPAMVLAWAMHVRVRQGRRGPLRRFWFTVTGGFIMSGIVCGARAALLHGQIRFGQVLLGAYFATGLLLLLKGFDLLLGAGFNRLLRADKPGHSKAGFILRQLTARLARAIILLVIGFPYVLAACLTYRTHVGFTSNPYSQFGWSYKTVSFKATDGIRLSGWFIPAAGGLTNRTVIFCHGLDGTRATQLFMVRKLVPAGFNVLTFDFRGTGDSGGQLISFGDLEKRDVLGAVHWLRTSYPQSCGRVLGLGVDTGTAALIEAAADPSPDGQTIDAVAAYSAFDRLEPMVRELAGEYLSGPAATLLCKVGLPLASVQCGTNLMAFDPATAAAKIWPRPLLVVQAIDDQLVDFTRGQNLYDHALQPKYNDWVDHVSHEQLLEDNNAARFVLEFFESAKTLI